MQGMWVQCPGGGTKIPHAAEQLACWLQLLSPFTQIVVLEKTLESPLDSKEIKPVNHWKD